MGRRRKYTRKELPGGGDMTATDLAREDGFFGAGALVKPGDDGADELYKRFLEKVCSELDIKKESLDGLGYLEFADSVRKARYVCMGILCGEFAVLMNMTMKHLKGKCVLDKTQVDMLRFLLGKILPDGGREVGFVSGWMSKMNEFMKGSSGNIEGLLAGGYRKES